MLLRKFSWLYRCANWRYKDFFVAENIKDIKSFRTKKIGFNISGNYSGQFHWKHNVPHVARNVWLSGFQMFVLFEVVINEPTFPLSHTLQATCGTLLFLWEQTPYSHQARRGTFLTSAIRPIPLSRTLLVGVWHIAFLLRTSSLSMQAQRGPHKRK